MNLPHFDRFLVLSALGAGLFLIGGVNLLLRGRPWLRAVLSVALASVVLAGLVTMTHPELAVQAALMLTTIVIVVGLLGNAWVTRQLTALMNALRKPAIRWALVTTSGLLLLVSAGIAFEYDDNQAIDQSLQELELTLGRPSAQPTSRARATADRGTTIVLREPISPRSTGELIQAETKVLSQFSAKVIRRGEPSDHTNCHGWVFTGGQYLLAPEDVELILHENGYWEVNAPRPGDLVVYRQNGTITHTAIVRYVTPGQPVLVEGKWGVMGVFLHEVDKSCYGTEFTYYRNGRANHLLVGFGGSSIAPNTPPPGAATE